MGETFFLVPLTQGFHAEVDEADYEDVMQYKWFARYGGRKTRMCYAIRHIPGTQCGQMPMHDHLMSPGIGLHVDHIDGNSLNNRRSNLRVCTEGQNQLNKGGRGGKSKYKGVWYRLDTLKWAAEIRADKRRYTLGCFADEIAAAMAYDEASIRLHGEFARLNFPRSEGAVSAIKEGPGYVYRKQTQSA